jgi:hypothetical protein
MPGQNHTNNAAKKKHRSRKLRVQRLAEENVVFRDDIGVDCLDDCPDALRDLFRLVQDVRNLRTSLFGTKREKEKTVRECYETELKAEADELSTDCRRDRMPSASEEDWVASLKPIVFHRFNQAQDSEVLYRRMRNHYWYVYTDSQRHRIDLSLPVLPVRSLLRFIVALGLDEWPAKKLN